MRHIAAIANEQRSPRLQNLRRFSHVKTEFRRIAEQFTIAAARHGGCSEEQAAGEEMAETLGSVAARTVAVAARTNTIAIRTDVIAAKTDAIEQRLETIAASVDDRLTAMAERFQSVEKHLMELRQQIAEEGERTRRHLELAAPE